MIIGIQLIVMPIKQELMKDYLWNLIGAENQLVVPAKQRSKTE